MEIHVQVRTVYGNTLIYPVCSQALLFAKFNGAKTLTRQSIEIIKQLGYAVRAVDPLTQYVCDFKDL